MCMTAGTMKHRRQVRESELPLAFWMATHTWHQQLGDATPKVAPACSRCVRQADDRRANMVGCQNCDATQVARPQPISARQMISPIASCTNMMPTTAGTVISISMVIAYLGPVMSHNTPMRFRKMIVADTDATPLLPMSSLVSFRSAFR